MSSNPVPFFSNLVANLEESQHSVKRTLTKNRNNKVVFRPFLGLPCHKTPFSLKKHTSLPGEGSISQILNQTTPNEAPKPASNSILAEVETPRIVEKQWRDINQPNLFSLTAATNTVENFVKVAKKTARQLNPSCPTKKRKKDIFDL